MKNPHFVYINSRDRESGTDEDFTYNINFPAGLDFTHVVCLNALVPKSYYLIQNGSFENIFQLQEDNTIVTITVPLGNYNLQSFRKVIGELLTSNSPNGLIYTVSYPSVSGPDTAKWIYKQDNALVVSKLIFNEHLFEPFGFYANSTNTFNGTLLTSTCVIKLQSEDRLVIHSNIVSNPTNDDILVTINSTTSVNYSSIVYESPAPEYYSRNLSSKNNNVYRFTLTDENGEIVHLNGLNLNMTIVIYRRDETDYSQELREIKDHLKLLTLKLDQKKLS
ncbi:MAG TPA: hypothetical protein PLS50_06430 [Candidatus Dojkabacteria bacterium]|nr:hypothetical protein [Candidatus Dojkabacteria bacterium]